MKIGILTFSHTENMNYGAMLQTFALYSFLQQQNYDPYIIKWKIKKRRELYLNDIRTNNISQAKRYILFVKRILSYLFQDLIKQISLFYGEKVFINFFNQYLIHTTSQKSKKQLTQLNDAFDCFIVGSDQVWRYSANPDIETFFLSFVHNEKLKIAYAASFGIATWDEAPERVTEKINQLISRINYISVREQSGVSICKDTFNINATLVVDPTMLLDAKIYEQIIATDNTTVPDKYIGCMFLDDTINNKEQHFFSKKFNLDGIPIKGKSHIILGKSFTEYNQVSYWLKLIKNADFVITDSFHCTIFCILFKKKFAVIKHQSRGIARLENLLIKYNLADKLYNKLEDIDPCLLNKEINYNDIDAILQAEKSKSINFLTSALKNH